MLIITCTVQSPSSYADIKSTWLLQSLNFQCTLYNSQLL